MLQRYKVALLGANAVGKTWICHQLVGRYFDHNTLLTIGADFWQHTVKLKDETLVQLSIYDTAGQERFLSAVEMFYQGADGIIMVYDITDKTSFQTAMDRINALNKNKVVSITIELSSAMSLNLLKIYTFFLVGKLCFFTCWEQI